MEMDPPVQRVCERYRYICFYFFYFSESSISCNLFLDLMKLFRGGFVDCLAGRLKCID